MNIGNLQINKLCLGDVEVTKAYLGDVQVYNSTPTPPEPKYMTMTVDESNSGETIIKPTVTGSLPNLNLQYRINNGDWTDFVVGQTAAITAQPGDVVQWKGVNPNGLSTYDNRIYFEFENDVHLSGNVMSLIDGVGDTLEIPCDYCFYALFKNSTVTTVSEDFLPATTLKSGCYRDLFSGCEHLTQAPALPAMELETFCYSCMFGKCTALQKSPDLNAKLLSDCCYEGMFQFCYSLNYVKCLTEDVISSDSLLNWMLGVSSTGTFVKHVGVTYPSGDSGIPSGWTIEEI